MSVLDLEIRIAEARPRWPAKIDSAWAVFNDDIIDRLVIQGPFETAEDAHRVSIPNGGCVFYDITDPETLYAMLVEAYGG
jgi:hypothetical protein